MNKLNVFIDCVTVIAFSYVVIYVVSALMHVTIG
jgi:hypothetical protein